MKLDLFNNLFKSTKENEKIQNFINELGEFLENNLNNSQRNELSLLQKVQSERKITASYKDRINIERGNIVGNYAKETSDKGKMYFIYSKSSQKKDIYNSSIYENGKCVGTVKINKNDLPKDAGVDCILRKNNGKYVFDKETTEVVQKEISKMINQLLNEQEKELAKKRVEGHIYKFVEKTGDTASLIDKTDYSGECFQEIDFPYELLIKAVEGDMFKYVKGEYIRYQGN